MVLRFENWFKAIQVRRSRRTYVTKQIEVQVKESLLSVLNQLNEMFAGIKVAFIEKSPESVFVGAVGPYGKITGATAYFALIVDGDDQFTFEKAGYIGQAIVLEAAMHGLSTCWVGGYFNRDVADKEVGINNNERVVAVIPVGYARKNLSLTEKMMNQIGDYHKRKSVEEIVEGLPDDQWPKWAESVVRAANLSPSAYNRQSIRFLIEENALSLKIANPEEETNVPKGIDRGIVMLHTDVATKHYGVKGEWQFQEETNLVVFQVHK